MNQHIEQMIEKLQKLDAALEEMLPYLTDKYPSIFTDGSIGFSEPYDFRRIKILAEHFKASGFDLSREKTFTDDGTLGNWWIRDSVVFIVYFRPEMDGATCKLNKIGEQTKVVPIYEVTCQDA